MCTCLLELPPWASLHGFDPREASKRELAQGGASRGGAATSKKYWDDILQDRPWRWLLPLRRPARHIRSLFCARRPLATWLLCLLSSRISSGCRRRRRPAALISRTRSLRPQWPLWSLVVVVVLAAGRQGGTTKHRRGTDHGGQQQTHHDLSDHSWRASVAQHMSSGAWTGGVQAQHRQQADGCVLCAVLRHSTQQASPPPAVGGWPQ